MKKDPAFNSSGCPSTRARRRGGTRIFFAALGMSAAIFIAGCTSPDDEDSSLLAGLFLLSQSSTSSTSAATGAAASAGAIQSGVSTTTIASLFHQPDAMMAGLVTRLREMQAMRAQKLPGGYTLKPAAYSCQDGTCNFTASESITGSHTCPLGGTVTANSVTATFANQGGGNVSSTMNGSFTFANCKIMATNFESFPAQKVVTLNGGINYDGTLAGNGTFSGTLNSGSSTTTTTTTGTIISSDLTVDGNGPLVLSLTINTNATTTLNWVQQLLTVTVTGNINGTFTMNGTVNGSPVSISRSADQAVNNTITGSI